MSAEVVESSPARAEGRAEGPRAGDGPIRSWSFGRMVVLLAVAALLATGIRVLVVQAFVIPSSSMEPALRIGDRVLVSRWDYRVGDVQRGDVIVFDGDGVFDPPAAPRTALVRTGRAIASALGAPVSENDYVTRVIGLPGERVTCCDTAGRLSVDGRPLVEPYLKGTGPASVVQFDIRVPAGRLWVMGDNRDDSADSRAHLGDPDGGTVPLGHVVGRVTTLWWPWGRATGVGRAEYPQTPNR